MAPDRRNLLLGWTVAAAIGAMAAMSFAAVPLYRLFCAATGYGWNASDRSGAPRREATGKPSACGSMPTPTPDCRGISLRTRPRCSLKLGDEQVAFYHASNLSHQSATGMALYNVTPEKAGKYFHKTACFCFDRQTLAAEQTMEFPVSFWVDPAIRDDPNTGDVKVITLSYTFFRSLDDAVKSGALAKAGPHAGAISAAETPSKPRPN